MPNYQCHLMPHCPNLVAFDDDMVAMELQQQQQQAPPTRRQRTSGRVTTMNRVKMQVKAVRVGVRRAKEPTRYILVMCEQSIRTTAVLSISRISLSSKMIARDVHSIKRSSFLSPKSQCSLSFTVPSLHCNEL